MCHAWSRHVVTANPSLPTTATTSYSLTASNESNLSRIMTGMSSGPPFESRESDGSCSEVRQTDLLKNLSLLADLRMRSKARAYLPFLKPSLSPTYRHPLCSHTFPTSSTMEKTIADHVNNAIGCLDRIETMITTSNSTGKPKTVQGAPILSILTDALSHLKLAKDAAFNQHVQFALSPDTFNPFNLPSVERSFSRFSLAEPSRVLILKKHVADVDPTVEVKPAEERMGRNVSTSRPSPSIYRSLLTSVVCRSSFIQS